MSIYIYVFWSTQYNILFYLLDQPLVACLYSVAVSFLKKIYWSQRIKQAGDLRPRCPDGAKTPHENQSTELELDTINQKFIWIGRLANTQKH